jgi:hypothetical protein
MTPIETALTQTLDHLVASNDSIFIEPFGESSLYAGYTVKELIHFLNDELQKVQQGLPVNTVLLGFLFAPTACLQETAMEYDWHQDYLNLAGIIDDYISQG